MDTETEERGCGGMKMVIDILRLYLSILQPTLVLIGRENEIKRNSKEEQQQNRRRKTKKKQQLQLALFLDLLFLQHTLDHYLTTMENHISTMLLLSKALEMKQVIL